MCRENFPASEIRGETQRITGNLSWANNRQANDVIDLQGLLMTIGAPTSMSSLYRVSRDDPLLRSCLTEKTKGRWVWTASWTSRIPVLCERYRYSFCNNPPQPAKNGGIGGIFTPNAPRT